MNEITIIIEKAPEGGYSARAMEADIFTEHDTMEGLNSMIRDAVTCHFDDQEMPQIVYKKDEIV